MPQVPRLTQRVAPTALPGVRATAAETPLSRGVGLDVARQRTSEAVGLFGQQLTQSAGQLGVVMRQERDRADQVAALEYDNQLSQWENARLYAPETGALNLKGKAALDLPETVGNEFQDYAASVEAGLSTDRQKAAAARIRATRATNIDLTLRRHVYGEMQHYEAQELTSSIDNARNSAVNNANDPRRVGEELNRATDAIRIHGPRMGLGPEQIQQQVEATQSSVHTSVVNQLLATDHVKAAQIYFDETRGQINGDKIAQIEKALRAGSETQQAQKQSDEIIAAGGTLNEQRTKARAIEDPAVRDQVMQRIEHEDAVNDKAQRDAESANLSAAFATVDKTGSIEGLTPQQRVDLAQHMPALRNYANAIARGVPIETDLPTYYTLMTTAGNDPTEFAKMNLLQWKDKLGETELKQLANLQLSIKAGNAKQADKDLAGFRTNTQILDDSLVHYGIDPKTKDKAEIDAIATLRRTLDLRLEHQQLGTGKKPTNEDIQLQLDQILSVSKNTPGSWWSIFPGTASTWSGTRTGIFATVKDIPADYRRDVLERALRDSGRPVTDQTVLDLYNDIQTRPK